MCEILDEWCSYCGGNVPDAVCTFCGEKYCEECLSEECECPNCNPGWAIERDEQLGN